MGYLLVRILSANGLTYFQYALPFIPLLIYGVCLIITPIIISAICLKIQCRIRWWNGSKWQTDFEMSEHCNISPPIFNEIFGHSNISRIFGFYNDFIKGGCAMNTSKKILTVTDLKKSYITKGIPILFAGNQYGGQSRGVYRCYGAIRQRKDNFA